MKSEVVRWGGVGAKCGPCSVFFQITDWPSISCKDGPGHTHEYVF
jgi:hypothetical protein